MPARKWRRCMFHALQKYDVGCSPSHMGFRKTYSWPELVATMRLVVARRMEWGDDTRIALIDFARAYDSVRHTAIYRSLRRRKVPESLALAYLRKARRAHMTFRHANWHTPLVKAGVGLRQGCSAAPMLFRWVLQDALEPLFDQWVVQGRGIKLQSRTLTQVAWADDAWMLDSTRSGLESMLQDVATRAEETTGLAISVGQVLHRRVRAEDKCSDDCGAAIEFVTLGCHRPGSSRTAAP